MIDGIEQIASPEHCAPPSVAPGIRRGSPMWGWLKTAFKVCLGPAIVIWFLKSGRLNGALVTGALRDWPMLFLVFFILYSVTGITAFRWRLLLHAQNIPLTLKECFSFSLIGMFLGLPTPGGAGGDVAKVLLVRERAPGKGKAVAVTVLVDRIVGIGSLMALAGVAVVFSLRGSSAIPRLHRWTTIALAVLLFVMGAWILARTGRGSRSKNRSRPAYDWPSWALEIKDAFLVYRGVPGTLAIAVVLSFAVQLGTCASIALLFKAPGRPSIGWAVLLTVLPVALLAASVPLTPVSIGVGQFAFFTIFQLTSGRGSDAANAFTLYQCVYGLICLSGLGFYWWEVRRRPSKLPRQNAFVRS